MYSVLHLRQCWWQLNLLLRLCCYNCPLIFKESSKLFQTFISCTSSLLTITSCVSLWFLWFLIWWHTICTNHACRHTIGILIVPIILIDIPIFSTYHMIFFSIVHICQIWLWEGYQCKKENQRMRLLLIQDLESVNGSMSDILTL